MDTKTAIKIAAEIDYSDIRTDAREILNAHDGDDFTVKFGRKEYRIIHEDAIESIHREEIETLVDDCHDLDKVRREMGNLGQYMRFDYDAFARDARIGDGYGNHFASYDGKEIEVEDWHIFRTN